MQFGFYYRHVFCGQVSVREHYDRYALIAVDNVYDLLKCWAGYVATAKIIGDDLSNCRIGRIKSVLSMFRDNHAVRVVQTVDEFIDCFSRQLADPILEKNWISSAGKLRDVIRSHIKRMGNDEFY